MEKLQKESSAALLREAPSLHGISKMFNISCYRLGETRAVHELFLRIVGDVPVANLKHEQLGANLMKVFKVA